VLVFIAALQREIESFDTFVKIDQVQRTGSAVFTEGRYEDEAVVLVQSGIGMEHSARATRAALDRYRPDLVVSIGFCGALSPDIKGGELLVPDCVMSRDETGTLEEIPTDSELREASVHALTERSLPVHRGSHVSDRSVTSGPTAKARLASLTGADATDMESYWVGKEAEEAGVRFLAVHAASDEAALSLPDYDRFLDDMGGVRPLSAVWYYLTHPWHIAAAPTLAANARVAGRNLAVFGELFLNKVYRALPAHR